MGLIPLNLLYTSDGASSRSHLTCVYKCGDACSKPVPNTSANEYFQDVARRAMSRRGVLRAAGLAVLATGAGSVLAACGTGGSPDDGTPAPSGGTPQGMRFDAVAPNTDDALVTAKGYEQEVLIRWGDPVVEGAPAFDFDKQTAVDQARQYGYNCDFAGLVPIPGKDGEFVFVANHEYTTEIMMFRDYDPANPTREQAEIAWAAHGLTVVEVTGDKGSGKLATRLGKRNRRITATTPFTVSGPAAGHDLLKTPADPTGKRILGTLNNCAGGVTPWGTILSGEENCNQYFANADDVPDAATKARLKRYSITGGASERKWERFDDRFDLTKAPNEANRFNWIVEIDPLDPESTPVKHTALGRFKHEAGTIHVTDDGTVVCYSGDDERFEYIYKFVSSRRLHPGDTEASRRRNMGILTEGTLYVAKFGGNSPEGEITGDGALPADDRFDGTGEWLPIVTSKADGTAESHVDGFSGVEALVFTREAADKVGATKMDRPEDVEANPVGGKVYVALTNNKNRGVSKDGKSYPGVDEANPRSENKNGQVLEIEDDHAGTRFTWNLLLVCGDPTAADTYYGGFDKKSVSPVSCPDNLAFDEYGNLWISTDGNALKSNDGLYAVALTGDRRGETKCFLTVPTGAETCGPVIEHNRVIVNVQHPGEVETDAGQVVEGGEQDPIGNPASHWPDGGKAQPRPSTVVVWGEEAIGL